MTEKYEPTGPEEGEVHVNIDLKYPYTARAWHILTSRHKNIYTYEYHHDMTVAFLIKILQSGESEKAVEQSCKKMLGDSDLGQRIYDKYIQADQGLTITPYKKRKKKNEPPLWFINKKKQISYDAIGRELVRNFIRHSYDAVFPLHDDAKIFIEEHLSYSPLQLKSLIEHYVDEDDDEDDDGEEFASGTIWKRENAEYRRGYLLATILVRKSTSVQELRSAFEILDDIGFCLKAEHDEWQDNNTMPEFIEGGEYAFDELLWLMVCQSASFCMEDICGTMDTIADNADNVHDYELVDFFTDALEFTHSSDENNRDKAYRNLKETYTDICQQIEDSINGDADNERGDDTGEE